MERTSIVFFSFFLIVFFYNRYHHHHHHHSVPCRLALVTMLLHVSLSSHFTIRPILCLLAGPTSYLSVYLKLSFPFTFPVVRMCSKLCLRMTWPSKFACSVLILSRLNFNSVYVSFKTLSFVFFAVHETLSILDMCIEHSLMWISLEIIHLVKIGELCFFLTTAITKKKKYEVYELVIP